MSSARRRSTRHLPGHRLEILGTLLLGIAALATAWSTFQSGRWRGEQAAGTKNADAARIESSEAHTHAGQQTQIDIAVFIQWVNADAAGNRQLARFYRTRFRAEFRPAFDAWVATRPRTNPTAPSSPFVMPQYRLAATERAGALAASATAFSAASSRANEHADDYLLAVVLFAASLFFAGMSTRLKSPMQRELLLGFGWLMFLSGLVWVLTLPVSFSG